MARWKLRKSATFADMPEHLRHLDAEAPDELKRQRADWLEKHGLSFVDFCTWKRAQDPLAKRRPPSRRRWLSGRERAELDAERESEPFQW